ncbi:uncharacterized protein DSM5745_09419 [Aspergillus mulundensis]|uniref:Uncharacterized protein n=1 Tax=Aspergillus mulundensis TaxID=1810919 RepID=A0A3D8QVJ7_9EURO|nr:hypothetical protein DSM5745_09419 [Aspergillus mulundensis]RDW65680.1 hypothetical protein DSM5745_09419 [Aspergillus mulundensis]
MSNSDGKKTNASTAPAGHAQASSPREQPAPAAPGADHFPEQVPAESTPDTARDRQSHIRYMRRQMKEMTREFKALFQERKDLEKKVRGLEAQKRELQRRIETRISTPQGCCQQCEERKNVADNHRR